MHGTLSGDRLPHPNFVEPPIPEDEHWKYHSITIQGVQRDNIINTYVFNNLEY